MTALGAISPEALAQEMGWGVKRVRRLAKKLGACCILGNRMALLPRHVEIITKATEPCPSDSTGLKEVQSGTTAAPLPEIDYEARLKQRIEKSRRVLSPRSKTSTTNVVSMGRKNP